ncbi:amino acid adenylation domain-containing protein [Plantactinospora sp. WMMB334]|uniref:hybrid non-ribosomal peptide synthetase/type I polyketide synthase n=1 Tax=Plantactinospora sp. WMMB334 TaxID=3404119 RepID=UPI003B953FFD
MSEENPLPENAIAVIGMAVRVPGARTLDDFWQNLRGGVESIRTFTDSELLAAGVPPEELAQPGYVRSFGALEDVAGFDARLFGLSPREAQLLDPQHRFFLECAWEALEHAGQLPVAGEPVVGVYGGVGQSAYHVQNILPNQELVARVGPMSAALANDKDFLLTRVSFKLNLSGPSVTVQTACSTSLVAVHMACQALHSGDCDVALAGGARILLPAQRGYLFEPEGVTSPDGRCRAFDANANGSVPGNGAGVVVLKRLGDAVADRDVIHAVIRGSAINNDGARKVGFTAPSVGGQADVIAEALGVADVDPASISYVETHGSGTPLGDTIELSALTSVFGADRAEPCAIGSVKTNLGHLDAAAGVVGMIKTVLALRARELPPSLHFSVPHRHLGLADGPFRVNSRLSPWRGTPLRAGVSSFGIGGTNAHVVIEEPPRRAAPAADHRPQVLPLSAATTSALDALAARLAAHLRAHPDERLADVAHTLQSGRRTLPHRRFVVASTVAEAIEALERPVPDPGAPGETATDRDVVFLFPGQGTQRVDMGRALYRHAPAFRAEVDTAAASLEPDLGLDIRRLLYPEADERSAAGERIDQTRYAQPALFVVGYALAKLWMSWGVRPAAMLGHSIGEIVAACVAGVMTPADALRLVVARGRLMQGTPTGGMLAVPLPAAELAPLLGGVGLDVAAVNGPRRSVVSGPVEAVTALARRLQEQGVGTRRLNTSHAFHSRLMNDAAAAFESEVARVRLVAPRIPFVSNVTGTWITDAEATSPAYWARQMESTVCFDEGLQAVRASGGVLLEVGPGHLLTRLARAGAGGRGAVATLPSVEDGGDAYVDVLTAAAELWRSGAPVGWAATHGGQEPRRVVLPTYPFEHRRYWIDPPRDPVVPRTGAAAGPMVRGFRRVGPAVPGGVPDGIWVLVADPSSPFGDLPGWLDGSPVRPVPAGPDPERVLASALGAEERVAGVVCAEPFGTGADDEPGPWLVALERVLAARGHGDARVVAVVSGALEVTGEEALSPPKAALAAWAEGRPGTRALLDVAGPAQVRRIAAELRSRFESPVVALRGGHRFVPSLEPLRVGERAAGTDRHTGAHYAVAGPAELAAAFGAALSRSAATVSELSVPELSVPELSVPELSVPELSVPELSGSEIDGSEGSGRAGPDPSCVAVVVVDAGEPLAAVREALERTARALSRVPARACEVHVLVGDDRNAGQANVVAASVSVIQRGSAVPWTTYLWPSGAAARIDRYAVRAVGLAPGACQVVLPADDEDEAVPPSAVDPDDASRPDEVEATIAAIFTDLLGASGLTPDASFFALGGDSLLVVKLLAEVRRTCGTAPRMRTVVEDPTIRGIARAVRGARAEAGDAVPEGLPTVVADPGHAHEPFPLTELQQAFWVGRAGVYEIGNVGMHLYEEFDVPDLDVPRLERAWRRLVRHHPMLRMIVLPHGEQRILADVPDYAVATRDVRDRPADEARAAVEDTRAAMSHQVFDASCWPLFDVRATMLPGGRGRLHVSIDGLVTDAWAIRILKTDLKNLYDDPEMALPEIALSFRDYVLAEQRIEATDVYRRAERYWLERVATMALAPELPLARDPGTIDVVRFRKLSGKLPAESWARIREWAGRRGITPTAALLTAYSEAVATWSKSRRFTLNLPVANRLPLHPQVDEIVGDFTSVMLTEIDATAGASFETRARAVRDQLASDLDHRYFSGVRVQRALRRARGDMAAILPVVFTCVLHDEAADPRLGEVVYGISQTPQVWIDTQAYEDGGALALEIDSVEDLFPEGLVAAIHAASLELLAWLAEDEAHWGRPMPSLTPREDLELWSAYNRTEGRVPAGLLHEPFFSMAARMPGRPAVITPDRTVSYGELAAHAHGIAARLAGAGVRPNELVAVAMEKGWEQCGAVLGILASGAAYLPIDPDLPDERFRFLLEHGEVAVVLTQARLLAAGADRFGAGRTVLAADELPAGRAGGDRPAVRTTADDLAYVIFTSGSTGVPKGVMISHRGALNTVTDVNERFGVGPDDRVLALSSLSFDLSVYDIFGPLAVGGAVVMPAAKAHRDPAAWRELLTTSAVTVWNSVPALMELLVEHLGVAGPHGDPLALRLVMMSGDWIPVTLPDRIRATVGKPEIVSLGGATEASIWSILYPVDAVAPGWTSIPYGVPMRNQTFHVLDDALRPRPVWVPGQLYIGGVGLAEGYLRDEGRTRAGFVVHPVTGERLYRTGDLGRLLPEGVIEFLGREDSQVKIQGYRVELGEIEAAITSHPEVRAAVAVVHGRRHGSRRIVAFVAPRAGDEIPQDLAESLAATLPQYMLPAAYQRLGAVPLTPNGKVDRQALLVEEMAEDAAPPYVAPRTAVEAVVAEVWASILGLERVGVHDNFFTLGGDSLAAMRAVVHLRRELDLDLPMQVIFESQTPAGVAAVIEDELLTQLETMSEEDAESLLSR